MQRVSTSWTRLLLAASAVAALGASTAVATAYPRPHRVPIRWELNFEPGDLRLYLDNDAQPGDPTAYWYFTYKVVNNTGQERMWAPDFTLYTDNGEILRSGDNVPPQIEHELIDRVGNDLLERQNQLIGRTLFGGERNAIEGLVAWPAEELDVNELSIFIGGLSGESAQVENPVTGEKVSLYKTMQLTYTLGGDVTTLRDTPVATQSQTWVMR